MNWRVELYQKANGDIPVKDFLESLSEKHRAKAYWEIELLAEYGPGLKEPYVKHIENSAKKACGNYASNSAVMHQEYSTSCLREANLSCCTGF